MEVLYSPLDFWPIMRRAYAVIRPIRVVLVEAEVWPNLAAEARGRGHSARAGQRAPLAAIGAADSAVSFSWSRRPFVVSILVCVQEPEDVERWVALGVPRERIHHVGSIKYDPAETRVNPDLPLQVLRTFGIDADRPILFGGSTHAGEEEVLGKIFQTTPGRFPGVYS